MKGKTHFTEKEIKEISQLIEEKLAAPSHKQKAIRDKIRELGFYGGDDFGLKNYTVADFLSVINKEDKPMQTSFTWVPAHKRIVEWLQEKERAQREMISILKNLGITGFKDTGENNQEIELTEVDPFTFFCYLYKHGSEKRLELLQALCKQLNIDPLPKDDNGIPSANAQKVWLFPWKFKRTNNEIARLWKFFHEAVKGTVTNSIFEDVRNIKNAGKVKLTEGLFYIDPERYLPINAQVKPYLQSTFNIDPSFETFDEYTQLLQKVRKATSEPFYKISYDAYLWNTGQSSTENKVLHVNHSAMHTALNQIFFGPPGTGKTYHTVSEAIKIADPEFYAANAGNRAKLKERFRELLIKDWKGTQGQIAFCTFHQSFSYEDFVEGIKPVSPEEGDTYLKYKVEDGIFKRICRLSTDDHKSNLLKTQRIISWNEDTFKKAVFYKISLGNTNKEDDQAIYEYCIKNNCIAIGYGDDINFTGLDEEAVLKKCKETGQDGFAGQAVNRFIHYLKEGNYILVSNGNRYVRAIGKVTGPYRFDPNPSINFHHYRSVEWLLIDRDIPITDLYDRSLSQQTIYKLDEDGIKKEFFVNSGQTVKSETKQDKKFVLIIDEINRGNVSSIFGELITLIEKDKRASNNSDSEELEVTLPYSKEPFKVPDNVFIIGTMNTADRSIEALDTALRRRFSFREMPPEPTLISPAGLIWALFWKHKDIDWKTEPYKTEEAILFDFLGAPRELEERKKEIWKRMKDEKQAALHQIDWLADFNYTGVRLDKLLQVINMRIEKLIDKDHKIGHSYFLGVTKASELQSAFSDKVIPLLQEYFFGDFGKIGLVLGNSFIEKVNDDFEFAKFESYDQSVRTDLKERPVYRITAKEKWNFTSIYE